MSYSIVRGELYVKIAVDSDEAQELLDNVIEAKELTGVKELEVSHEWYGINDIDDAKKHIACDLMRSGEYAIKDWNFTL